MSNKKKPINVPLEPMTGEWQEPEDMADAADAADAPVHSNHTWRELRSQLNAMGAEIEQLRKTNRELEMACANTPMSDAELSAMTTLLDAYMNNGSRGPAWVIERVEGELRRRRGLI